ncbi:hypothetical protein SAMN05421823_11154 [Catalinimonas alkaloidigena]|uniref:Uncharacterized protein n=1 Tax=Catalinimonas alkaloidigena TaxID=1075417 RepID=A0A1G9R6F5_9BACT|nr:hypothetical protein [Catalinimonas alkaloidigena]SDM18886.1 hypothetical protein SAMN05421823_11154 [Catalinimonas alkaloidigena]
MKLRIKGNSIRLRLTQSEVDQVANGATVRETVQFGPTRLTYALVPGTVAEPTAAFEDHELRVELPQADATTWAYSDEVGIQHRQDNGTDEALFLLIEKDFQCLHKRPLEDETDHFPNPQATPKRP